MGEMKLRKWLTNIFQNKEFDNFELKFPDYDKNGGYAGEIEFADVITEKNGKKETIKLLIKKNKESDTMMNTLNLRVIYANEVNLYSKTLPHFEKFAEKNNTTPFDAIPRCYGTVQENDQFVLVLENLKPKGYRTHELHEYLDLNHMKLILEAYGKWHAFNLAFRSQHPEIFANLATTQKEDKMLEIFNNTIEYVLEDTIELFKRRNKNNVIDNLKKLKESYVEKVRDVLVNKNEEYIVVKHGDNWNNNFLFHYNENQEPDKVVIIDWQLTFFNSPLVDVTNLLFGGSNRKGIEQADELLKFYHNALSVQVSKLGCDPAKIFPWEACMKSFLRYAPFAIAMIPSHMKMRYKKDSDTHYDIEKSIEVGNFSGVYGDDVSDPEKYFEDIYSLFEYFVERKWI